jgi:large subunit ribosomal protein L53
MITKYITEVTTRFNPFKKPSKTCRVFLAHLPADARTKMKINTTVLGRDSQEPSVLKLTFSM